MNTNKTRLCRLVAVLAAFLAANVVLGKGDEKILEDNSGTLLTSPDTSVFAAWSPTDPAMTIPEAISSTPLTTESFSTIEYTAPTVPAVILPGPNVPGPGPAGFLAVLDENADPYLLNTEAAPVAEPATWAAGLLATCLLLQIARKRRHCGPAIKVLPQIFDRLWRKRGMMPHASL